MALRVWALEQLRHILPLEDSERGQILDAVDRLDDDDAAARLQDLLGDSDAAGAFTVAYLEERRRAPPASPSDPSTTLCKKAKAPPSYASTTTTPHHTNVFIEAAQLRARDEQHMQQFLQHLQYQYGIYNSDVVPEHDSPNRCNCPMHEYRRMYMARLPVMKAWSKAVRYPGEKIYSDFSIYSPYFNATPSVFGRRGATIPLTRAVPSCHADHLRALIVLNDRLNRAAQANIDAHEPKLDIWADATVAAAAAAPPSSTGGFARLRRALGATSSEQKEREKAAEVRAAILAEEHGRWPDSSWRRIVAAYQDKVGMAATIAHLRRRAPVQYLHLLRAGYFEPIPVAWASQAANPLTFVVDAEAGTRGVTPAWRGYEDLAEERLYWVLNHRADSDSTGCSGLRLKPDPISALRMARDRMATAVEPPPLYFSADDTCLVQQTQGTQHAAAAAAATGYSKQVMPPVFRPVDGPARASDDTMILLDVSGSMAFDPMRPIYDQYLITGYARTNQPKNKDVARAIVRRFTDALAHHHDHQQGQGYDLVTFSDRAAYVGTVHHATFDATWRRCVFGGQTRVMAGWQLVKDLHFQKHAGAAAGAEHHSVYGWQAGPATPLLRLLLLLDGEAADMDEFELDLLGLSWAHVTIFLLGVDGCPHHHRHANELQRISDVNPHVSFIDAQGNCPERFVTHELLKRHLGYDMPLHEFEQMEGPPVYTPAAGAS